MRLRHILTASLVLLAVASTAEAAGPPSFARWAAQWTAASDRAINAALDPCQQHFVDNALKAGTCSVRNVRLVYARARPIWERALNTVAQGQTTICRAAIHAYWLAARAQQDADLGYLDRHTHITVTQLNADLSSRRFKMMSHVAASARQQAIRICG
jgi:hypothetical protein